MIYFIRHTRPNVEPGICYGVTDLELDPLNHVTQVAEAAQQLKGLEFSAIYSSPLKRCRQLAERIAKDNKITLDARLKEMDFGEWEMTKWSDIFETQKGKEWFADFANRPAPKGESFTQMVAKAKSFLKGKRYSDRDILVVTHAGFIRASLVATKRATCENVFDQAIEYGEIIKLGI